MRLDELYPYWDDTHGELLERLALLTEIQLDTKPHDAARSIRQIVLDLLFDERFLIAHLVGGYVLARPNAQDFPTASALVEALESARQITARVLEPISREGLRAVRVLPADQTMNQPETNVPIAWLVWRMVEQELFAWGQIKLRLDDNKTTKPSWN